MTEYAPATAAMRQWRGRIYFRASDQLLYLLSAETNSENGARRSSIS